VIIFVLQMLKSGVDNDGIEFEMECFDVLGQSHHKFLTLGTKMKKTPLTFFSEGSVWLLKKTILYLIRGMHQSSS